MFWDSQLAGNELHIYIYSQHVRRLIIDPHNNQLQVGMIAQLVEHYTGIAEVRASNLFQAWTFLAFLAIAWVALQKKKKKDREDHTLQTSSALISFY